LKRRISLTTALALILFSVMLTFQVTYHLVGKEYQDLVNLLTHTHTDFSKLSQADQLIRENFYGEIDEVDVEKGIINGYLSALQDPYSRYLTPEEYRLYQKEYDMGGVGIGVRFTYDSKKGETVIYTVYPSSPADRCGIKKGDIIYKVGSQFASDLGFYETVHAISGEKGASVNLTVLRRINGQTQTLNFSVFHEELQVATIARELMEKNGKKVGYVQIFDFTKTTPDEFQSAVNFLKESGAASLVLDVRNASGSNIEAVCEMLDLLLPKGDLVRLIDGDGKQTTIQSDENCINLPCSVLINSSSACAAELLAATMRDFKAATLIGETTWGKSIAQAVIEMDDGSALILSNRTILPPIADSFDSVGVDPDVKCILIPENLYLATKEEDNQLQEALKRLTE